MVRLISSLVYVDAYVISSAYFALTVKECRMLNGCKGATSGFSAFEECTVSTIFCARNNIAAAQTKMERTKHHIYKGRNSNIWVRKRTPYIISNVRKMKLSWAG